MDLDTFIARVRNSKQFDHLYHFTDRSNLPSIKTDGILCTSELRRLGRLANIVTGGDANSLASDAATGTDKFVCLCFTTNHPMSFRAAERGVNPVYLSIDPEIIKQPGVMITDAPSNQRGIEKRPASAALDNLHLDSVYQFIDWSAHPEAHDQRIVAEKYEILIPTNVATKYIARGL